MWNDNNSTVIMVDENFKVGDYFDVYSYRERKIRSIYSDVAVFLYPLTIDAPLSEEGDITIREDVYNTLTKKSVIKELKKLGFRWWQIKKNNATNLILLYKDSSTNTKLISNKMILCGWHSVRVSVSVSVYNKYCLRIIEVEPDDIPRMTYA